MVVKEDDFEVESSMCNVIEVGRLNGNIQVFVIKQIQFIFYCKLYYVDVVFWKVAQYND